MRRRWSRSTATAASEIEISRVLLVFVSRTALPSRPSWPSTTIAAASRSMFAQVRPSTSEIRNPVWP